MMSAPTTRHYSAPSNLLALACRRRLLGVSVWWADVQQVCAAIARDGGVPGDDLASARRWRCKADRDRHVAARALLRCALSETIRGSAEIAPEAWRFEIGASGKPCIAAGLPPLEFNLSHSGEAVAVAIHRQNLVGVDIEELPPDGVEMIEDVLSGDEKARVSDLIPAERGPQFLSIWTAKEACAKAVGRGVDVEFSRLDVDLHAGRVTVDAAAGLGIPRFAVCTLPITVEGRGYLLSLAKPE